MDQEKYIDDKCREFPHFIQRGGSATPLPSNYMDKLREAEDSTSPIDPSFPYAPMLGSLMFAMISTRPDISTAVSLLSRHVRNLKKIHCNLLQHVFRYDRYIIQYKHQALLILKKLVLGYW